MLFLTSCGPTAQRGPNKKAQSKSNFYGATFVSEHKAHRLIMDVCECGTEEEDTFRAHISAGEYRIGTPLLTSLVFGTIIYNQLGAKNVQRTVGYSKRKRVSVFLFLCPFPIVRADNVLVHFLNLYPLKELLIQ